MFEDRFTDEEWLEYIQNNKCISDNYNAIYVFFKLHQYWSEELINRFRSIIGCVNESSFYQNIQMAYTIKRHWIEVPLVMKLFEFKKDDFFNLNFVTMCFKYHGYKMGLDKIKDNGFIEFYLNNYNGSELYPIIPYMLIRLDMSDNIEKKLIDTYINENGKYELIYDFVNNKAYLKNVAFINKLLENTNAS